MVNWYNGSLDADMKQAEFDLTKTERIAIVGNGNIACDISRVLLRPAGDFSTTDCPDSVIEQLKRSSLHTVEMVGRRGITQAAFTTKEIKELCNIEGIKTYMVRNEVEDSMTDASKLEMLLRGIGRRTEFLQEKSLAIESYE